MTLTNCYCCGLPTAIRNPMDDPWHGRLDGYCDECATARCDAFPGECPNKVRVPTKRMRTRSQLIAV